jgi:hypothetical protein
VLGCAPGAGQVEVNTPELGFRPQNVPAIFPVLFSRIEK